MSQRVATERTAIGFANPGWQLDPAGSIFPRNRLHWEESGEDGYGGSTAERIDPESLVIALVSSLGAPGS